MRRLLHQRLDGGGGKKVTTTEEDKPVRVAAVLIINGPFRRQLLNYKSTDLSPALRSCGQC
jgi:hypothetical protein